VPTVGGHNLGLKGAKSPLRLPQPGLPCSRWASWTPSSVFAAFNRYGGQDREIETYEYNGHEGGQLFHGQRQVAWLQARLQR
jgi:hypothetical protein